MLLEFPMDSDNLMNRSYLINRKKKKKILGWKVSTGKS